jgi:hypothetical protein
MEEMVAEKMIENSKLIHKDLSYDDVMTPVKNKEKLTQEKGE